MKIFPYFILLFFIFCYTEPTRNPKINGVQIPDRDRKLFVYNFRNNSYASGIHTDLTRELKREINRRSRFIQTEKTNSNYTVSGEIVHYQLVGNLMDSANNHISSEMTVVVKIRLEKKGGGSIPLQRKEIPARVFFSGQIGFRESEDDAKYRAVRILSARIAREIETAWYYSLTPEGKKNSYE